MTRVVIITNIPAPYRVKVFNNLQQNLLKYDIYIIYTKENEDNRKWKINREIMRNSIILNSKVIKIKTKEDNRYIHLPIGLNKTLNEIDPEIVISFEYNLTSLIALRWSKKNKRKFINLTDGTLFSERNINFIQKLARKIIISKSDAFIASGTKAKEKLLKWGAEDKDIFIAMLTTDVSEVKVNRQMIPGRILYVGSCVKRKGIDLLLEALRYVSKEYNLHIVGNGSEQEIRKLELLLTIKEKERVKWIGYKEGQALWDEYNEAELFVLPSREDCFGLVMVEAMFAHVPILASKYADGAYDIITEGINGHIVDPYNTKMFSDCINDMLGSEKIQHGAMSIDTEMFEMKEIVNVYNRALDYVRI